MKNYTSYFIEFVDIMINNNIDIDIEELNSICKFLCF